ncbi:uncharacterized protein LOC134242623 [Saccostrea cucullata]|uniref:uncharacterized protein LOC134242623 n=1 Tax=Saccostrea cuccullata TaxID=36930 RepID=UPI002ED37B3E
MRIIFAFALLIVAVYSETCNRHEECKNTICGTGAEIHCIFHTCTCTMAASSGATCTTLSDCHDRCSFGRQHHCIDGHCRCTHF